MTWVLNKLRGRQGDTENAGSAVLLKTPQLEKYHQQQIFTKSTILIHAPNQENMSAGGKEDTSSNCLDIFFFKKTHLQRDFCVLNGKQNNTSLRVHCLFQGAC